MQNYEIVKAGAGEPLTTDVVPHAAGRYPVIHSTKKPRAVVPEAARMIEPFPLSGERYGRNAESLEQGKRRPVSRSCPFVDMNAFCRMVQSRSPCAAGRKRLQSYKTGGKRQNRSMKYEVRSMKVGLCRRRFRHRVCHPRAGGDPSRLPIIKFRNPLSSPRRRGSIERMK